jgi:hypothetical protein
MRISVVLFRVPGAPGHEIIGVKACVAVTLTKTRLGPGRPATAHELLQEIERGLGASLHSQLIGKLAGKESAGLNVIELVIALWMSVWQVVFIGGVLRSWIPDLQVAPLLAYSAPILVTPASASVLVASVPKSAIPATITAITGTTNANSTATLPSRLPPMRRYRRPRRLSSSLRVIDDLIRRGRRL